MPGMPGGAPGLPGGLPPGCCRACYSKEARRRLACPPVCQAFQGCHQEVFLECHLDFLECHLEHLVCHLELPECHHCLEDLLSQEHRRVCLRRVCPQECLGRVETWHTR